MEQYINGCLNEETTRNFPSMPNRLKLFNKIKNFSIDCFASDYWKSNEEFIFVEKHLHPKVETRVIIVRIRHYIARFKIKTKCYSKSNYMIEISLNLLMLKLNNELHILN